MATLRPFRDYPIEPKPMQSIQLQAGRLMNTEAPKFATMNEVVMKKEELLSALITNKAKHDVILATAIAGYWETAKAKLEEKHKKLNQSVKEWQEDAEKEFQRFYDKVDKKEELPSHVSVRMFALDNSLGLVYPQDHSRDYDRAIRMMQSSIYDEVQLTTDEYDAYVLNNWEWKKNFLATNTAYLNNRQGRMLKSTAATPALTGNYVSQYDNAQDNAVNMFQISGCLSNF